MASWRSLGEVAGVRGLSKAPLPEALLPLCLLTLVVATVRAVGDVLLVPQLLALALKEEATAAAVATGVSHLGRVGLDLELQVGE